MELDALQHYLHRHIPISAAMQVTVQAAALDSVTLAAPLLPNINHKSTAFGGSISTLGILAAWSLVNLRLMHDRVGCEVVIQSSRMDYDSPITGAYTARSTLADPSSWGRFLKTLERRGLGRVEVESEIIFGETVAARMSGRFVAQSDPAS